MLILYLLALVFLVSFLTFLGIVVYCKKKGNKSSLRATIIVYTVFALIILFMAFNHVYDYKYQQNINIETLCQLKLPDSIQTVTPIASSPKFIRPNVIVNDGVHHHTNKIWDGKHKEYITMNYQVDKFNTIDIDLELFNNFSEANNGFQWEIDFSQEMFDSELWPSKRQPKEDFIFGGEGTNRYCKSYIIEMRNDPEGGSGKIGKFYSKVWILKNNLLISITEESENKVSKKDEVIKVLSDELEKITTNTN